MHPSFLTPVMKRLIAIGAAGVGLLTGCAAEPVGVSDLEVDDLYFQALRSPQFVKAEVFEKMEKEWKLNHAPFLLESVRFARDRKISDRMYQIFSEKTGVTQPQKGDAARQWLWAQKYEEHPEYADFKASLYRNIDRRFFDYFSGKRKATIRLDEIRWGGVIQDGIPPLHDPVMIPVEEASYLGKDDVVFGIEVNGEPRAYPKRILAWHEMFTDTIQGIPLAGVY